MSNTRNSNTRNVTRKVNNTRRAKRTPKRRGRERKRNRVGARGITRLTEINNQPVQTRSFRFEADAITNFEFQARYGLRLLSFGNSGSTTFYGMIEAYRLKSISITLLPSSATNSGTFSFRWESPRTLNTAETLIYTPAVPSRWTFVPQEDSLAAYWVNSQDDIVTSGNLFDFQVDNATVTVIMDMHIEYMFRADGGSASWTGSIPSSTGVFVYSMPYNSGNWTPVGVTGT